MSPDTVPDLDRCEDRIGTGPPSQISYVYINDLCTLPRRARPDAVLTVGAGRAM